MLVRYRPDISMGIHDCAVGRFSGLYNGEFRRFLTPYSQCSNVSSPLARCKTAFEFYIPEASRISESLHDIDYISLNFYIPPTGIGLDSSAAFNIHTFLSITCRNLDATLGKPQIQIPNTHAAQQSLFELAGTNYIDSPNHLMTPGSWKTIYLSSAFTEVFLERQTSGFILLDFARSIEVAQNLFIYTSMAGYMGQYAPYLEVSYTIKEEPATITSFELQNGAVLSYSQLIPVTIGVSDTEEEDQQIEIQGRAYVGGNATACDWKKLDLVESSQIPSSTTGRYSDRTVISPFRLDSFATPSGFMYYKNATLTGGASLASNRISMPNGAEVYQKLYSGKDLAPDTTYRFGGSSSGSLRYKVLANGGTILDSVLASGAYGTFSSGTDSPATEIELFVENTSGSNRDLYLANLIEDEFDSNPWVVELRARVYDDDGYSSYFNLPHQLDVDGRAPTGITIIDTLGGTNGVYQTSPTVSLSWNPSTMLNGTVSGYRYLVTMNESAVPTISGSPLLNATSLEVTAPYDGRWYIKIAPQGSNGILGDVSVYGLYYNMPAVFNDASGIYIDQTRIYSDQNTWVKNNTRPVITWGKVEQEHNVISYELQVGVSGGVEYHEFGPYDIDWSLVPSGQAGYFRLESRDMLGIRYLDVQTKNSPSGWYVFDSSLSSYNGSWIPLTTKYVANDKKYTKLKFAAETRNHIPDRVGLFTSMAQGYFDNAASAFSYSSFLQPRYDIFHEDTNASGVLFRTTRYLENGVYTSFTTDVSTDGFATRTNISPSTTSRCYSYISRHEPSTKLAMYFDPLDDEDASRLLVRNDAYDKRSPTVLGSNGENGFSVDNGRVEGLYGLYVLSSDARLRFADASIFNPEFSNFSFSFWMKSGGSTTGYILSKILSGQAGFSIELTNTSKARFVVDDGVVNHVLDSEIVNLRDGEWHHLVLNMNRRTGTCTWYIDGIQRGTATWNDLTASISNNLPMFLFGGGADGSTSVAQGLSIDDFVFLHRNLSSNELQLLHAWNHNGPVFGMEELLGTRGLLGDDTRKTFICRAFHENGLAPNTYDVRYKSISGGIPEDEYTLTTAQLATTYSPPYEWMFESSEISVSGITIPRYDVQEDLSMVAVPYFVRVRCFDGHEYGNWSKLYKFTINSIPSAPTSLFIQ